MRLDDLNINGASSEYANGSAPTTLTQNGTAKSMNGHQSTSKGTNGHVQGNGHLQLATRPQGSYFGHDREEATRLIIQGLLDLGYESAANRLIQESGFELETPSVAAFRHAVLNGNWEHAEELLFGPAHSPVGGGVHIRDNGLILADHADESEMRFWLRQQKFLELLEAQETGRALAVLRTDLTPLYQSVHKLHFLSSLLMCHSTEDLRIKADWDGAQGSSRRVLLSELSKCLSPSVMIPEHRLAVLMDEVQRSQAYNCLWHSSEEASSLYVDHTCSKEDFPREVAHTLKEHRGEVWFVAFSNDGSRLASCGGSEDCRVVIWDTDTFDVIHFLDEHNEGVSSVAWSPNDELLVTCSLDRCARVWETETGNLLKTINRFEEPVSGVAWAPDGQSFVTSSLYKSLNLSQWSIAGELIHDWSQQHRVQDVAISPNNRYMVAMDNVCHLHVYNIPAREHIYELSFETKLTSVDISKDSKYILVNKSDGGAQMFNIETQELVREFVGHKGGEFVIRAAFGGANENFVISGSQDGQIFIWHRQGKLLEQLSGHFPKCCSAVSWNPTNPRMFASGGDDGCVRIFRPSYEARPPTEEEIRLLIEGPKRGVHTNGSRRL